MTKHETKKNSPKKKYTTKTTINTTNNNKKPIIKDTNQATTNNIPLIEASINADISTNRAYLHQQSTKTTNVPSVNKILKENNEVGDSIQQYNQNHTRIYFQNINGAKVGGDWMQWLDAHNYLQEHHVNIIGMAETNINWNYNNIQAAQSNLKKIYKKSAIATSSSIDPSQSDYLPGGTATVIVNNLVGNIQDVIKDTELGRWSGYRIKCKNKRILYIITCYMPIIDTNAGSNTCYQQQWRILRNNKIEKPNPRQQLFKDLRNQINQWTSTGNEVILMTDANEAIGTNNNDLNNFLSQTKLTSLINVDFSSPPATHARGKTCIDYIFGSTGVAQHVVRQGYLPFYDSAWESDHRALFVDINTSGIFGLIAEETYENPVRGISSTDKKSIQKFINKLHKDNTVEELYTRICNIENQEIWSQFHHQELEYIDSQFTKLLIKCDQQCIKKPTYLWSPDLHNAHLILKYWKIYYKSKRNHIDSSSKLTKLQALIDNNSTLDVSSTTDLKSAKYQLQRAKESLDTIRRNALEHREHYLTTKQEYYIDNNQLKKASAIKALLSAERSKRCFRACARVLRPNKSKYYYL